VSTSDSRVARFDHGVAALALLCGFVFAVPSIIPLVSVLMLMSAARPDVSPVPRVFEALALPRLPGPPQPEPAGPWRAAALLNAALLGLGTLVLVLAGGDRGLAWAFGLPAAALGALASVGGFCLGCRLYTRRPGRSGRS
jgi:hypothetical protein